MKIVNNVCCMIVCWFRWMNEIINLKFLMSLKEWNDIVTLEKWDTKTVETCLLSLFLFFFSSFSIDDNVLVVREENPKKKNSILKNITKQQKNMFSFSNSLLNTIFFGVSFSFELSDKVNRVNRYIFPSVFFFNRVKIPFKTLEYNSLSLLFHSSSFS